MLIINKPQLSKLEKAKLIYNHMCREGIVEALIKQMRPLDPEYTNVAKGYIIDVFGDHWKEIRVEVNLYTPWYWRSKAYARTFSGNYRLIELSSRRMNRTIASITGSLGHEHGHLVEFYAKFHRKDVEFNHGDNKSVGKEDTFQYQLGRAVKKYVEDNLGRLIQELGIE